MGQPFPCYDGKPPDEFIVRPEPTGGIETSYVPPGTESNNDCLSSGERKGNSLNSANVIADTRCSRGVAGYSAAGVSTGEGVKKYRLS